VMGMPTLALFIDGEVAVRFMGAKPRAAIMALLEPHLPAAQPVAQAAAQAAAGAVGGARST